MLTCGDLGLKPEEVETLQESSTCIDCEHRMLFHGEESGFCIVNGCHCCL
jgi:hypothetical protein